MQRGICSLEGIGSDLRWPTASKIEPIQACGPAPDFGDVWGLRYRFPNRSSVPSN